MKQLLLSAVLCACAPAPKIVADEASLLAALNPKEACQKVSYRVALSDLPDQRLVTDEPDPAMPTFKALEKLGLVTLKPAQVAEQDIVNVALSHSYHAS